jgi:hypothetical protein
MDKKLGEESRILVFVLYKKEADRVLDTLRYIGYTAGAIHGDLGQAQRMKALEEFKSGKTGLLVATDVAARGLDIPDVAAVINYSFPLTIEGTCRPQHVGTVCPISNARDILFWQITSTASDEQDAGVRTDIVSRSLLARNTSGLWRGSWLASFGMEVLIRAPCRSSR